MSIHQPIQLPVQTFTSEDANVPQLTPAGAAGEVKSILKACLSTGYGTTAAATGWEMAFEDGDKAVFRSTDPRATGFCLRIDNNTIKGGQVTCYETMSDVDTGAVQWHDGAAGFVYYSAAATSVAWRMYVTPVSFILITDAVHNGNNYQSAMFFGDLMTTKTNDGGNCFVFHSGAYVNGAHPNCGGFAFVSYTDKAIARDHVGATGGVSPGIRGLSSDSVTQNNMYDGHHGYPCYLTENNAVRLLPPWLASNKREFITAGEQAHGGRQHYVTNLGRTNLVYFIPTDYWLL